MFKNKQCGATVLEYTSLVLLLILICVTGIAAYGENLADSYCRSAGKVKEAGAATSEGPYYYNKTEKKCCYDTGGWGGGTYCP